MTFMEWLGLINGYGLGCFTALISFLRSARMFHPRGIVYEALVESDILPPYAMVRLSSAWWKNKEWIDVLGVAIRFSDQPVKDEIPRSSDQDLLFASFSSPWQIFIGPFITNKRDFFANTYFGVGKFERLSRQVKYHLKPRQEQIVEGTRKRKLEFRVLNGDAVFRLKETDLETNAVSEVAVITLIRELNIDQEALRFWPFQNGADIRPRGYLQYLRVGSYRMSQWARS